MRKPTKQWMALILALWACVCLGHAAPDVEPSSIYGHWVVKRLIPTSGISAGPGDLDPWIDARVSYSVSEASFGNHVVENVKYKITRVSAEDFFRDSKFPLEEIGIHSRSVIEINLVDDNGRDVLVKGPGSLLFIRSKNVLVTVWNGGYFEMIRAK
jgi:hypothetical protein